MEKNPEVNPKEVPVSEKTVFETLKNCYDPEIPINIVDLGLVYSVKITGDRVEVTMTLTTPGCGMGGYIANQVRERLLTIPGIYEAEVKIVWEPKWDQSLITGEGRKILGLDT
jgi:metal-sulfur cluster biosynthetic enzyme